MMSWFFGGIIAASVIFSMITGRIENVSNAVLDSSQNAITLAITLLGSMAFWSGIMQIAESSGLIKKISKLLSPMICKIFSGVNSGSKALQYICMNVSANLLGLGNVATPLGISAMEELHKNCPDKKTASRDMIMLVVINTASVQLLPTTIATLRYKYGSKNPLDILPAVLFASVVSVTVGICSVLLFSKVYKQKNILVKGV